MLWLGQGQAFSFSISPVHVRALASSLCGDERKMSLMSCAAELSARGCCMGVLSLHCALMVLQWSVSSWQGFSRGAERAGRPLKAWRALHRGLQPLAQPTFYGAVRAGAWCWVGHSSWCQGSAVERWLSTLRAIPLGSPAVPVRRWLRASSGATSFWKPQKWSSPLGRQFLSFSCGAGVNCVEVGSSLFKCPQHQSVTNISSPFPGAFGGIRHPSNKAVSRWPQHMAHVSE